MGHRGVPQTPCGLTLMADVKLYVMVAATILLSGCGERWSGFVYPNRNDLTKHINIGDYKTLEECGRAARNNLQVMKAYEGDYECGLNCKPMPNMPSVNLCEKTER
jgi:hypothetical protein